MCDHQERPYSLIANLRQPMSGWRKLGLVLSNTWLKVRKRQGCCGNYGQPGC